MEVLRDPVWQFVGAVLALVAIVIALVVAFVQQRKKSLAYEILTSIFLLTVNDDLKGKTKILFEDVPVKNVYLVVLHFLNDGNISITATDFESPLLIHFSESTKILSAELVKTIPQNLRPQYEVGQSKIEIHPMLFNGMDAFLLKLLLSEFDGVIHVEGRIKGVKEIRQTSFATSTARLDKLMGWCSAGGLILLLVGIFFLSGWLLTIASMLIAITFLLDANVKKRKNHIDFRSNVKGAKKPTQS
jgi:hypothetical protein